MDKSEDELNPAYVLASSSSNTTVTVQAASYTTASLARFLRSKTILNPAGTEILVQMATTAAAETGITIAAYGNTTWASWTMTKCYIIAQPFADIDSASADMSQTRSKRKNFMQVFERAVEITQTRKNLAMEAVIDELQTQIRNRTFEIKRELNQSIFMGYPYYNSGFSGDLERRTMGGLVCLIRDWDLDGTNEDTMVIDASSAALTIARINSLAYQIADAGGLDETSSPIIVVGMKQAQVIAGFEKELRRVEQGERQVGFYRNTFMTDIGVEMPVVVDRWCPKDKLFILDRSRMSLRPMSGDQWHLEKMAKTGRNEKWQLSGQYTLELRNADKCHGFTHGLA